MPRVRETMARHTTEAKAARESRSRAQHRRLVVTGVLGVAVLAGLAMWYFSPRASSLSAAASYHGGPRLAVDTQLIDFGPVRFDQPVRGRFLLRNVGDQPLQIAANPPVEVVEGC